jgi:glucose/arabinose dehydrogenase
MECVLIRAALVLFVGLTAACATAPDSRSPIQSDSPATSPFETEPTSESKGSAQVSNIRLQEVASGLASPVFLGAPIGDSRLFVVEKPGRIRIVDNGQLLSSPYLDITDRVGSSSNEQGLLGMAFHPGYASNGLFFVNYTDKAGDTQIERYRVTADRDRADRASAKRLLSIDQPFANHNGGMMAFGADGMLYIGTGDGGSGADPQGHGQNLNSLLGKILRIDVDRGDPYGVPAGNPFIGRAGTRPEIWASGLRNPWRFSFDHPSGLLYVADVGQNAYEEINVVPAAAAGLNFGWNRMEATRCFRAQTCDRSGLHLPQLEYGRSDGCSVTGGYVYRGRLTALVGEYFYADYCQPGIRSFRFSNGAVSNERQWQAPQATQVSSFGQGADGELYVLSLEGRVFKIVPS